MVSGGENMKPAFYNITKEKQDRILNACISEFANHDYNQSSLNNIIKAAGISKGGLFKYISSKEELYLYTMEIILTDLITYQNKHISHATTCYFDRMIELAMIAIEYYRMNHDAYKAILTGFLDRQAVVYQSLITLRLRLIETYKIEFLKGIDWSQYRLDTESLRFVVGCALNGYNLELLEHMKKNMPLEDFKEKINKELGLLLSVLKEGVCGEV